MYPPSSLKPLRTHNANAISASESHIRDVENNMEPEKCIPYL
jgi:hypothetical protein